MRALTRGAALAALLLAACGEPQLPAESGADANGATPPTAATIEANRAVAESLPLDDPQDFEDAQRGFIAKEADLRITGPAGETIWDMPAYDFIQGPPPDSVNPSLWRQARLNNFHGLFKVTDGVYQLRGYDLSNMTLIEGRAGWIVVDPLTSRETGARAMQFALQHLPRKPVTAVIFSHSHVDHFAGVLGVLDAAGTSIDRVRVVAPKDFMIEAPSENTLVGVIQGRRAIYQFGRDLPRSIRGQIDSGVGKTVPYGLVGILEPTDIVDHTGQELVLDGVRFQFQDTPDSEAPVEFNFYLPEKKALFIAEIAGHTLHNLYTLRGTKVRDALKWSDDLDEALSLFGQAEIFLSAHGWPIWDNARIRDFLEIQRDTYKYIHDQTLRQALIGGTPLEIAEAMQLPPALQKGFANRSYYGTLSHNSKGVYQHYLGWFDGIPAHLNPLPPVEAGKKYVEFMGGADEVLRKAQGSYDAGEYRWAAEVLNHLVFADPDNTAARTLLAKCYDQLGYQAESSIWRNFYLTGAHELRHGTPKEGVKISYAYEMLKHTPVPRFLEVMAAVVKAPEAEGKDMKVNLVLTDIKESYVLHLKNSVLHFRAGTDPDANGTLEITHDLYLRMVLRMADRKTVLMSDDVKVRGSRIDLMRFFLTFDNQLGMFNIVTP